MVEFLDVIPRLTDPEAYGGRAEDAFHVIAPSLPGYGFSEPPRSPGWDVRRIAQAFVELMARLGYPRYVAQGGDWGAQVTTRIGAARRRALRRHPPQHGPRRAARRPPVRSPTEEQADLAAMKQFSQRGVRLRRRAGDQAPDPGRRPQRLAGRPAGLDRGEVPDLERLRRRSGELLHPRSAHHQRHGVLGHPDQRLLGPAVLGEPNTPSAAAPPFVDVPTGVARYPKEVLRWPRSWVERQYNVVHWAVMDRGGHFPAMEQPELFVDDLRTLLPHRALSASR